MIPYRSVLEFYFKEIQYLKDSEEEQRRLALKRKRGPVNEQRRQALIKQLEKARAARTTDHGKIGVTAVDFIEKVT
jgi:hypothetical protein